MFLYNNKLYQDIKDVATGCPQVPTIANFLLEHIKQKCLIKTPPNHLKMCVRYMDDILQFSITKIMHAIFGDLK